jgi:hypothetical protein
MTGSSLLRNLDVGKVLGADDRQLHKLRMYNGISQG